MLALLHIENIAVIEMADVAFAPGFNVLTGETGAGKSIVVDAINMVIGERASRELIRSGAKSALVTAVFQSVPPLSWLEENGIAPDEDGNLLLSREIHKDGRSFCRVGGRPVPVSALRTLGNQLLNIHGQHDGQQLLNEAYHLSYLDRFAGTAPLLQQYRKYYDEMAALRREISSLRMDEAEKSRRMDTLRYQIDELERAQLKPGEQEALDKRRKLLQSAGKLMDALEEANFYLNGSGEESGAVLLVDGAQKALRSVCSVNEELSELSERAAELSYEIRDLGEEIRDLIEQYDFSPEELDTLESRLDQLYRLGKKYGPSTEDMLSYLDNCQRELERIEFASDTLNQLEAKLDCAMEQAREAARALTKARKEAASQLEEKITQELHGLDMKRVSLVVELAPKNALYGMDETGMDDVRFLLSANLGEAPRPIHKIASGGELSRVMLAMKNILAEDDDVGTLVFDEIDTGVSGRAANRVAEKLRSVARHRQVLCVTHLPQIAAAAEAHFGVEKGEVGGRTYTAVERLTGEKRAQEIARIVSGDQITDTSLHNAREMLNFWSQDRKSEETER